MHEPVTDPTALPYLLNAEEVAALLRTSTKAIYARASKGQIAGKQPGRPFRVHRDTLLESLSRAPSPKETRR